MNCHRTTARGVLLLLCICGAAVAAAFASAAPAAKLPQLVFPVLGPVTYTNDFGDARAGGGHQGNDLMAAKRSLALAAEGGTVKFWTTSAQAGCMLYLYGDSGTMYLYIHLNNDVTTGNDNRGSCVAGTAYAPGMKSGDRVSAGQPVGFVGDSGDANGIEPHLHFEVHPGDGAAVSPFKFLNRGYRLLFAAPRVGETALWLKGSVLAQLAQAFKVQVSSLGVRATGLKLNGISRPVSLGVSPATVIESLAGVVTGDKRATIWTEIAPVTLDAQLGKPGALTAQRVLLGR
jgi:hypothetical protein